ncbi:MAG: hypothetical protein Q8P67_25870 [archaeon]|nr:hypothetical protein [archaeon]
MSVAFTKKEEEEEEELGWSLSFAAYFKTRKKKIKRFEDRSDLILKIYFQIQQRDCSNFF